MMAASRLALLALLVLAWGCKSPGSGRDTPAYASPEAAVNALVAAARQDSTAPLHEVLGPRTDAVLESGDAVQLRNNIDLFLALFDRNHALASNEDGTLTLVVGQEEWPFPIPLTRDGRGWYFDTEKGEEEIVDRRIGRNELWSIGVCRAVRDAQNEYRLRAPEGTTAFAAKFFSDPGRRNGLFWPVEPGTPASPLGELVAAAAAEGYRRGTEESPRPYHGYRYRLLTEQGPAAPGGARSYLVDGQLTGGFAVVAWPAEYGRSGIMTFQMNHFGIVYECDLGEDTASSAPEIRAFDPGDEWTVCED